MTAPAQRRRRLAELDPPRQPLDDGGLADAGVADEQRVVLAPARQHVQRALDLRAAPDQRIDLAGARALVQVDRVRGQRIDGRLLVLVVAGRPRAALPRHARRSSPAAAWRCRARCS